MENGETLVIKAHENSMENVFIESIRFQGQEHNKTWLDHHELQAGGSLEFTMTGTPNKTWGVSESAAPFSLSNLKD